MWIPAEGIAVHCARLLLLCEGKALGLHFIFDILEKLQDVEQLPMIPLGVLREIRG